AGIGRATCLALAQAGAAVAAVDVNRTGAEETASLCQEVGAPKAVAAELDVRDWAATEAFAAQVESQLGPASGVVTCAGVGRGGSIDMIGEAEWDEVLDINLKGTFLSIKAFLPQLRKHEASAVVTIASVEGIRGSALLPAYCASKHGVIGLTRSVALLGGSNGIRANAICPGFVETPMTAPFLMIEDLAKQFA